MNNENILGTTTLINKLILSKYKITKEIGRGSFGTVYKGIDTSLNKTVAIKAERKSIKTLLEKESIRLQQLQSNKYIPKYYLYTEIKDYNILIMELLGKTLGKILEENNRKLSIKSCCYLGIEMINILQLIHSKGIIHRDIKPDNFIMGRNKNINKLFIIDFGLSKHYLDSYYDSNKHDFVYKHIPYKSGKNLTGTARYCSIYTHQGIEQSRRDDIESIGYLLVYFIKGKLPWIGIKRKNRNDKNYSKILEKKLATSIESLCSDIPNEFCDFFYLVKKLKFDEEPNYSHFKNIFINILNKYYGGYFENYIYEWNNKYRSQLIANNLKCNTINTINTINTNNISSIKTQRNDIQKLQTVNNESKFRNLNNDVDEKISNNDDEIEIVSNKFEEDDNQIKNVNNKNTITTTQNNIYLDNKNNNINERNRNKCKHPFFHADTNYEIMLNNEIKLKQKSKSKSKSRSRNKDKSKNKEIKYCLTEVYNELDNKDDNINKNKNNKINSKRHTDNLKSKYNLNELDIDTNYDLNHNKPSNKLKIKNEKIHCDCSIF